MKILIYGLLSLSILLLTSCGNVKEELWINADGSGRTSHTTDASELAPLFRIGLSQMQTEGPGDNGGEQFFIDLLEREVFDSTFSLLYVFERFAALGGAGDKSFAELILEDVGLDYKERENALQFLDVIDEVLVRTEINMNEDKLKFHVLQEFSNVQQVNTYFDEMVALTNSEAESEEEANSMMRDAKVLLGGNSSFRWDGKELKVKINKIDRENVGEDFKEPMMMMAAFLNNPQYQMVINLPKKVKSVDHPNAVIEKKKKVILSLPFEKIYEEDIEFSILTK